MIAALIAFALAILMLLNAGYVSGALYVIDWIAAIFFATSGAINGWTAARK